LWDDTGPLPITRRREVGSQQIGELLGHGLVQFVVATCGRPLQWVALGECYQFWKEEVKPRLVEPSAAENGLRLEEYPGSFCFVAAEWGDGKPVPVIVLETHH
jgi:hypothetical protein